MGSSGWYTGPVTVTLMTIDPAPGTGVASTVYSLDSHPWLNYKGPITVPGDGMHRIDFYSTDNAGNVEAVHTQVIDVDSTAPVTRASLSGPRPSGKGWFNGLVTVTLTALDRISASGVAHTQYCIDGETWKTYTDVLIISGSGIHRIKFFSTDNAGNSEAVHHWDIKIDVTSPVVIARATPSTLWPANGTVVSVVISGTITDALSGVDPTKAAYSVEDEYGLVQPSGTFRLNPDSTYSFTIRLLARRDGQHKDGRNYIINLTDVDEAGNTGTFQIVVTVPQY
jgi:hypothetical protein